MLRTWRSTLTITLVATAAIGLAACSDVGYKPVVKQTGDGEGEVQTSITAAARKATCVLRPTEGNEARGVVTFTATEEGTKIVADLEGLAPGEHGFHVHEFGDCTADDGTSAGGHFDPEGVRHGGPDDDVRHVGDLGNIVAGEDGTAHLERVDPHIALSGPHSILARSVIVHGGADDLESQPSGDAGSRVAYGVIGIAEPAGAESGEAH